MKHIKLYEAFNQELFPKEEMIQFMKSIPTKKTNPEDITDFYYKETENPFDYLDVISLYFNNKLLINFSKTDNGEYTVKIGENTGWVGGLSFGDYEYAFEIPEVNFNQFKKGMLKALKTQKYALVSKYGSGSVHKLFLYGSMKDIKEFAASNDYEIKNTTKGFYLYKSDLPQWKDERVLSVIVLSPLQAEKLQKE